MIAMAFAAVPASAGSQVVTGDDEHCSGDAGDPYCDYTRKVLDYARGGAPDPSKPILAIECGTEVDYIRDAYDPDPSITVICPGTPEYDATVFSTDNFSAIAVGAGEACNDVLNPRANDFAVFFNQGGGIATFNAACDDEDLNFLPLDVTLIGGEGNQPYSATAAGNAALGITDEELNDDCCQHETYAEPGAGNPLQVGARNEEGDAILLFARVDRRAPTSSSSGCASGSEVAINVSDESNGSGPASVRYTVDGGSEQSVNTDASGNARVSVAGGQHTVVFRGVDRAGNVEANANSVTVTCSAALAADTTRPLASISGRPRGCVSSAFRVRVRVRDRSGIARVTVHRDSRRLVNRSFSRTTRASFTVRVSVAGVRAGRHVIRVGVRDAAGNRRVVRSSFRRCARRAQRAPTLTG